MIPWLVADTPFPPVAQALRHPNGLLAAGGNLSATRLLDAYRHGIFPWFSADEPLLWWSPDPRMVLMPDEFRVSRSLGKVLRKRMFGVSFDSAFEQVMRECAAPRTGHTGTWIHEEMVAAYRKLHEMGYAHSVEVWHGDELAGGVYGVAIGRMFYGESMFSRRPNASKVALACLSRQFERWKYGMIDCQMYTPHLASLGARLIPRDEFIIRLQELVNCAPVTEWRFDPDLFPEPA